ncbi:MAG: hypothetical protein DMD58_06460 [Gemmatimonadetes bacterium]|nr:MAG: hypothetical protein DMD58_06460 [Gemmatimonadota bacterium]
MLLALLLLAQNPVTVRLNHDQFTAGDHARVYVQTEQDGYLVVLHAEAEGRVRVLYPLDPSDDDFVRGGKKLEVRGRADRDAFQIEGNEGSGTVLAAVAPDAFAFGAFARNDHWDFRALGSPSATVKDDPLARLLDIVRQMSGDSAGRFDYDSDTYVVNSRDIASRYGYGSGYGFYPYHFGYYDPFCYDPFFFSARCYGLGYGFGYPGGFGFGFGFSQSPRATWGGPTSRPGQIVRAHRAPSRAASAAAARMSRAVLAGSRVRRRGHHPVAAAGAGAAAGIKRRMKDVKETASS